MEKSQVQWNPPSRLNGASSHWRVPSVTRPQYGPIFRTSVAGRAVVVSADPEFNYFIFKQQGRLVESWSLDLFAKLFNQAENGPDGGYVHKYVRNLTLSHFGVESLKEKLLSPLEAMVRETISTWSNQESTEVKDAVSAVSF
ncbi:hypothetical protein CRYUN_Cryun06bG0022400 [Craigia yunnanensis]